MTVCQPHHPDPGRNTAAGETTRKVIFSLAGIALATGLTLWWLPKKKAETAPVDITQLQGDPIRPLNTNPVTLRAVSNRFGFVPGRLTNLSELAATNAAVAEVTGLGDPPESTRRKRPKPGSYPKRLVDRQVRLLSEGKDPRAYDTNLLPDGFVLTNLPPPEVQGYDPVSFSLLAGYEFDLRSEVIQATNNPAASQLSLAQVPPEVRALHGRKTAISGFLLPMRMDEGLAVEFLLMRDQTLCCFGRTPRINEWISVRATGRGAQPRMDVPLTVCGTFTVSDQREQGTLIGLYQLEADKIIEPD